jgi:hypothetical protein
VRSVPSGNAPPTRSRSTWHEKRAWHSFDRQCPVMRLGTLSSGFRCAAGSTRRRVGWVVRVGTACPPRPRWSDDPPRTVGGCASGHSNRGWVDRIPHYGTLPTGRFAASSASRSRVPPRTRTRRRAGVGAQAGPRQVDLTSGPAPWLTTHPVSRHSTTSSPRAIGKIPGYWIYLTASTHRSRRSAHGGAARTAASTSTTRRHEDRL